ncbi:MAG TPA: hypothetical protein VFE61_15565 [Candidatus Sulfotelmatobacter sp.]|nr:hypothetical protein [Candidatus Sulfotelmatobacter sp.]
MKRLLSVLMMCVLASGFALASVPQGTLTPVRATHQPTHRHRAHRAGKHHHPKRHYRTV